MGDKGTAFYRLVVAESRSPRDGKFVAQIGHFDPKTGTANIEKDETMQWLAKGAVPTVTAKAVLEKAGVMPKEKATAKTSTPKPKTTNPDDKKKKKEKK
jgi:small subunit ribosomal protein S16